MKRSTLGYSLAALVIVFSLIAGCTTTPRTDFANAQDTFNATVTVLIQNRDQFSDEAWEEDVLPLINAGDAALDQYDLLTSNGLPADSATATLRQVLVALALFLEQVE